MMEIRLGGGAWQVPGNSPKPLCIAHHLNELEVRQDEKTGLLQRRRLWQKSSIGVSLGSRGGKRRVIDMESAHRLG